MHIDIIMNDERATYKHGESEVYYRRLGRDKWLEIQANNTHPKKDDDGKVVKGHDGLPVMEVDTDACYREMIDYIVTGWNDFVMNPVTKKKVECNLDSKLALPGPIRNILEQLAKAVELHSDEVKKKK